MYVTVSSWKSVKFSKGLSDKLSSRSLPGTTAALDSLGMSEGLRSVTKLPYIEILNRREGPKVVL